MLKQIDQYHIQITLFGVMPTWTDMLGAGLVLGTVACITFEKTITEKCDLKRCRGDEEEPTKEIMEKEINEKEIK